MFRILAYLCAFALLIGSGIAQRLWTGAWNDSNTPAEWSERLENVPLTIGLWQGEKVKVDEKQFQAAEVDGYLVRRYVHWGTRQEVLMLIVCGRPGPVSVHTPDVCFSGTGFELVGKLQLYEPKDKEGAPTAEFILTDMERPQQGPDLGQQLRVYWSWNRGGPWRAPKHQRWAFGGAPALYKMYLIYQPLAGAKLKEIVHDPCRDFIPELLPVLDKALSPTS
jgi:hypothetical protein